jgi:hypothetical protein
LDGKMSTPAAEAAVVARSPRAPDRRAPKSIQCERDILPVSNTHVVIHCRTRLDGRLADVLLLKGAQGIDALIRLGVPLMQDIGQRPPT